MKIGAIPENLLERIVFALGLVPTPVLDSIAMAITRVLLAATRLGVFEAFTAGALTADEAAARCGADPRAMRKFLNALVGMGYLRFDGERYALTSLVRKWLLKSSPNSVYDNILQRYLEWEWLEGMEDFVRSGKPLSIHEGLSDEEWGLYQRGQRGGASLMAPEVARRTPVPPGAHDLLDIGGSHGYFSVVLCRRYPSLRAVVLDLPQAIRHAAPLLAKEGMGDRVVHRAGNALTDDLGTEAYDVVLLFNLAHHFDDATNRELARHVARALRPGGVYAIGDVIRPRSPNEAGQIGTLTDLYFAALSEAGTWSFEEMAGWQHAAGLTPHKPIRFPSGIGFGVQVATKQGA